MNVLPITAIPVEPRSLYDRDFLAWLEEQQQHLRSETCPFDFPQILEG
jgi:hypothetical protein